MFQKKMFLILCFCLFESFVIHAEMTRQSVVFSHCDRQILLNANALQEVFDYVMKQLDQQSANSISVSYTKAGYTLLQALQQGGYLHLTVENSTGKTYIDWLIQKSATSQQKPTTAILKEVKNILLASSHTIQ